MNDRIAKAGAAGAARMERVGRLLAWGGVWLGELREHAQAARMDDVERVFFAVVSALRTVHEALLDASWELGAKALRAELLEARRTDALLLYVWKAGNADVQGPLLGWASGLASEVVVIDAARMRPFELLRHPLFPGRDHEFLMRYLYRAGSRGELAERLEQTPLPAQDRLDGAGVRLRLPVNGLMLRSFMTREPGGEGPPLAVPAPSSHAGQPIRPIAHLVIELALAYYEGKAGAVAAIAARAPRAA